MGKKNPKLRKPLSLSLYIYIYMRINVLFSSILFFLSSSFPPRLRSHSCLLQWRLELSRHERVLGPCRRLLAGRTTLAPPSKTTLHGGVLRLPHHHGRDQSGKSRRAIQRHQWSVDGVAHFARVQDKVSVFVESVFTLSCFHLRVMASKTPERSLAAAAAAVSS